MFSGNSLMMIFLNNFSKIYLVLSLEIRQISLILIVSAYHLK
jgi:hypothetical protein